MALECLLFNTIITLVELPPLTHLDGALFSQELYCAVMLLLQLFHLVLLTLKQGPTATGGMGATTWGFCHMGLSRVLHFSHGWGLLV